MELLDPAPLPTWFIHWVKSDERAGSVSSGRNHTVAHASGSSRKPLPAAVKSVRISSVRIRLIEWLWPGWSFPGQTLRPVR